MLNVFGSPSRYVQGKGATATLGLELSRMGLTGPALLIAGATVRRQMEPTWVSVLEDQGIALVIRTFGGECAPSEIDGGISDARACAATVIIGAGGGKCLDTARAVAGALDLAVVNCPSLASSDAPCSALSVVYTDDGTFDHYLFYKRNPDLVLVDTSLVARAPVRYLVAGMGDALATWFEARTVVEARQPNQLQGGTTLAAGALARLCHDTLMADGLAARHAVEAGVVTPALERTVEANTLLSGLGFESGGLAIAHSVHNGLTAAPATHSALHGEKVAFGLLVQLIVEGRPQEEVEEVLAFSRSVGLPVTLEEVGLDAPDAATLLAIAERAAAPGETAHHEPFAVTAGIIEDGVRAADAIGRHA
ncbi:MAG: glycerol dehydrogenase [Acidimicrobiales bacterium]|jgi:glycerol dehydrogenase